MSKIELVSCNKTFIDAQGREHVALSSVDLSITAGEFICIVGASGCGKTTLLNIIGGFDRPTSGAVLIDGADVLGPDPRHIKIFQEHALFPWRTALANVCFGLEAKGIKQREARRIGMDYLALVGLTDAANRFPAQLSGGMRQRVALARALAVEPDILLMDEPFGALDSLTRYRLQDELLRIRQQNQPTIIFVTHDIDEALYLANRVVVMRTDPGRISYVYEAPEGPVSRRDGFLYESIKHEIFAAFHDEHASNERFAAPPIGL